MAVSGALQPSFDDLGQPLSDVSWVVVDLETTGGSADDAITEIGAVRVRGGEIESEFATLVQPGRPIPALIQSLTGITNAMVADAPRLDQALLPFLEFARDAVLVAHNARFDVGFLRRSCDKLGVAWPNPTVIDTVAASRAILLRDEVPNHKLSTLAHHFGVTVAPNHRALTDARATVEVLHALLERVGNQGVHTLDDLQELMRGVSPQRRAKRTLADKVPTGPGVYQFYADLPDSTGRLRRDILYVGRSVRMRSRVRSYFTASETRPRMEEMVRIATGVDAIECRTPLEAEVLELRLIAAHRPRYNRRSKFPDRQVWLKLTVEPFPRLSIVRHVADDQATYLGPLPKKALAEQVALVIHDAFGLRRCTQRLSPAKPISRCAAGEMGRCVSPCDGTSSLDAYAAVVDAVRAAFTTDIRPIVAAHRQRLTTLVDQQRFEEAAEVRERLEVTLRAIRRHHQLAALTSCPQIVAAERTLDGWEIHVIRYGRLAAAALARPGEVPQQVARDAVLAAAAVPPPVPGRLAALTEEVEHIERWLARPGVRLIEVDGTWAWPAQVSINDDDLPQLLLG